MCLSTQTPRPLTQDTCFSCSGRTAAEYRKIFNAVAPPLVEIYPGKVTAHFGVRQDLVEIKAPRARTVYCELGFHTNRTDVDDFIHDPEKGRQRLWPKVYATISASGFLTGPAHLTAPVRQAGQGHQAGQALRAIPGQPVREQLSSWHPPLCTPLPRQKVPATHVTGTFYRWDDAVVSGHVRITNLKSRVGVAGQVTGWMNKNNV